MPTDSSCIFCKIATRQIPSNLVFQDQHLVAFLDVAPLAPGHLLVVPKEHFQTMDQMPSDAAGRLGAVLPALVKAVSRLDGVQGVNILQNNGAAAGQVVEHIHIHVIPRAESDGLGYRWRPTSYKAGEAEAMRDRIEALLAR